MGRRAKPKYFITPSEQDLYKYFVFEIKKNKEGIEEVTELPVKVTKDLRVINHRPKILKLNTSIRKQIIQFHLK